MICVACVDSPSDFRISFRFHTDRRPVDANSKNIMSRFSHCFSFAVFCVRNSWVLVQKVGKWSPPAVYALNTLVHIFPFMLRLFNMRPAFNHLHMHRSENPNYRKKKNENIIIVLSRDCADTNALVLFVVELFVCGLIVGDDQSC